MYVILNINVRHIEYTSHKIQGQYVESRRYHDGGDEGLSRRILTAHV